MGSKKLLTMLVLATSILTGTNSSYSAIEEGKLVIWINGDKGYNGLADVGKRFTADTGIPVEVAHPDAVTDKFQQAAATGNGPDIFIWAHDRFGEWAASGLISPVNPSDKFIDSVAPFTMDAVDYLGQTWGYPIAVEAVGLIYNKDLISAPPTDFSDIPAIDKKLQKDGKKAILWDYTNTYFTWGMFAANGGYPFKKTETGYDTDDTGINNEGSIKAANLLKDMVETGLMPKGADYGVMEAAFNKGDVAMMINGPWSWGNAKKSGINFGVTAIPAVDGQVSRPFTGVLAATLNAASPNKDLSIEFLENYLLTVEGLKTVNDDVPLGAVANKELMETLGKDANILATFYNAELGKPMPNIPEMGGFWAAMEPALKNITSGRQSVEEALADAAKRVTKN